MKKLILFLAILISVAVQAQTAKILVSDETWAVQSSSGSIKVITCNDLRYKEIFNKFNGKFKTLSSNQKKDRKGYYWEYSFTFPKEYHNEVVKYLNSLPK